MSKTVQVDKKKKEKRRKIGEKQQNINSALQYVQATEQEKGQASKLDTWMQEQALPSQTMYNAMGSANTWS